MRPPDPPRIHERLAARYRTWRPIAAGLVAAIAIAVLIGWQLHVPALKRVLPGAVAMNPVTAIAFLCASFALAFINHSALVRAGGIITLLIGLLVLVQRYLLGIETGIDSFIDGSSPNVMAPTTALGFALIGLAIFLSSGLRGRADTVAQSCALAAALVSVFALTGYCYSVERFYKPSVYIAMAVHTAIGFLVLVSGLLAARAGHGLMARLLSARAGGLMLRRLLPATLGFPLVLGWFLLRGQRAAVFDASLTFTILVMAVVVFLAAMIWRSAQRLDLEDASREAAEAELRSAHATLESTVQERTRELRRTVDGVRDGLRVLGDAGEQILATSSALAASAQQTAISMVETTTSTVQVRQTSLLATTSAQQVAASAQTAAELSMAGTEATRVTAASIQAIRSEMQSIGERMEKLSMQTRAIGEIIAAVDELAQQSSLLAVNAAIEAAAAGAHGKGFAVVAQEVRYLADQSREATKQVRKILSEIQQATDRAVLTTVQAARTVESGAAQAARAGSAILGLEGSVKDAAQVAAEIAASTEQQLTGLNQVVLAMDQIKSASVENASEAQRLEAAARELNALGQRLHGLVQGHTA